jgi:hypothetical protein
MPNSPMEAQGGLKTDFKTGMAIAEMIAGFFAQTVEVFSRHNFGERYFSFLGVFGKVASYLVLLLLWGWAKSYKESNFLGLFFLGSFLMTLYHQIAIFHRNKSGILWHSRSSGVSYLSYFIPNIDFYFVTTDEFFLKRVVEPVFFVALGFFIAATVEQSLGIYLIFAGISLSTREALAATRFREKILDAIDAQIESKNLREAIVGQKKAEETDGFVFPVPQNYNQNQRESLFSGLSRIMGDMIGSDASKQYEPTSTVAKSEIPTPPITPPNFG